MCNAYFIFVALVVGVMIWDMWGVKEGNQGDVFFEKWNKCCATSKAAVSSATSCEDKHNRCSEWAAQGECEANPAWMLSYCKTSCHACYKTVKGGSCRQDYRHMKKDERKRIEDICTRAGEARRAPTPQANRLIDDTVEKNWAAL